MAPNTHSEGIEHAAGHGSDVFPPFDPAYFPSQIFWLALTFLALYVLLSRFVLPRIATTIEERRDRIADDLDAAAQARAEAEAAGEAYEASLADARAKAHAIAAETRSALDAELADETAKVEAELAEKAEAAEASIRVAKEKAFAEVKSIATTATTVVVETLAGVEITDVDAAKAVDKAMKGA